MHVAYNKMERTVLAEHVQAQTGAGTRHGEVRL
jgi:hypothetical protein